MRERIAKKRSDKLEIFAFSRLVRCPNKFLCSRPASGAYRPDECTNLSIMLETEQYCIFFRLEDGAVLQHQKYDFCGIN